MAKLSFSQHKAMLRAINSAFGTVTSSDGISIATINSLVNKGYLVQSDWMEWKATQSGVEEMGRDYQYMLFCQAIDRLDIAEQSLKRVTENKHGYYGATDHADALQRVVLAKQVVESF